MKNIMIWIMLLLSITYTDAQNGKSPRKDYAKLANYDESKVPQYTLPSVLMCHDGEMVQTKEQWEQKRRPEILNLFTTYMFGKAPVLKHKLPCTVSRINEKALNGCATRKEITIQLTDDPQGPHIDLQLYLPNHVSGKIPVFLGISFMPNYTIYDDPDLSVPEITDEKMKKRSFRGSMDKSWQLDKILEHGYGLATFCYNDVDPDFDDDFQNGVHPYYYEKGQNFPDPDQWGSIAAWAWGHEPCHGLSGNRQKSGCQKNRRDRSFSSWQNRCLGRSLRSAFCFSHIREFRMLWSCHLTSLFW